MLPQISSERERAEKSKRLQVVLAVFMVAILGASTASYALYSSGSSTSQKYNGIKFSLTENGWKGKGLNFYTNFLPGEVENVAFNGMPRLEDFNSKVYMILQPSRAEAVEFSNAVPMQGVQIACLPEDENQEFCADLPLKDCDDAGPESPVVIFKEGNETLGSYSQWCLQISGDDLGRLKVVDKVIYLMYGVIAG